ncbi:SAM-dependent methyltransferase [Kitasatospora sp. MMS16-BH015]|nr:class I SAM-dependent methyltransferase [Kitasatospora sp. MMS16-BH015]AUG75561.1 SAM-dependent methyltransferase [Kitasatospora sp. MMS16-BH015]
MYSDEEVAALYDVLNPWDPEVWPADGFHSRLVMGAGAVLDVGCGTGALLGWARENGHGGRLAGVDPDRAALARARARRGDVEWVEGVAAGLGWTAEFELATMTSHAFQCLVTDEEIRASLAAIRAALRPGGRFAFETRHPQARAWEGWTPAAVSEVRDGAGRALRVWYEAAEVEEGVVSVAETTADAEGTVLRVDRQRLRFLSEARLDGFLAEAGFEVAERYGDWVGGPVTAASGELVTVARRA